MRIQNYKKKKITNNARSLQTSSRLQVNKKKTTNKNLIVFLVLLTIILYNEQTGAPKL